MHCLPPFLLTILLCISCKKEPDPVVPPPFWGEASATVDGRFWVAHPTAVVNINHGHGWNIEIDSFNKFGILLQSLSIFKLPFTPGTYPIVITQPQTDDFKVGGDFFYLTSDQADGYYTVLESDSSSFVTMQSYDSITKELRGTFEVTLIAQHKPPYGNPPDTLRVRGGIFHTRVRDK